MRIGRSDLTATLGGVRFWGSGAHARTGLVLAPGGLTGWWEPPSMRTEQHDRVGHGAFPSRGALAGRLVTLTGHVLAAHERDLLDQTQELAALLGDGEPGTLHVQGLGDTTHATVWRHGKPAIDIDGGGLQYASFQLQLWAPDPYRYGPERSFTGAVGGQIRVYHRGNTWAAPTIRVEGAAPSGYSIIGPAGETYTVTTPVAPGRPHLVSMATGELRIAGVTQRLGRGRMGTHRLAAGTEQTVRITGPGTATATVLVTDTYL